MICPVAATAATYIRIKTHAFFDYNLIIYFYVQAHALYCAVYKYFFVNYLLTRQRERERKSRVEREAEYARNEIEMRSQRPTGWIEFRSSDKLN